MKTLRPKFVVVSGAVIGSDRAGPHCARYGRAVSVSCTGATIRLRIAQPDNGWRVEVENSGPAEIEVSFQRDDDDAGSSTQVTAVCATGTPAFKVENTD